MRLGDEPRIYLYDAFPGGIGFSAPLYDMHHDLVDRTRQLIAGCDCDHGCPTCVGPIGETGPRAKTVALALLAAVGGHVLDDGAPAATSLMSDSASSADLSAEASAKAEALAKAEDVPF